MDKDVAGLVEKLELHANGPSTCAACGAGPDDDGCGEPCSHHTNHGVHSSAFEDPWKAKKDMIEAASTIRALVAERDAMERRARAFEAGATKLQARAELAEAKLREAVGIIASQNSVIAGQAAAFNSLGDRFEAAEAKLREAAALLCTYMDEDATIRAFLATMEKSND